MFNLDDGYNYKVVYSKRFVKGPLKGLTIDGEAIRFVTIKDAQGFIKRALEQPYTKGCAGSGRYFIENPNIFVIERNMS